MSRAAGRRHLLGEHLDEFAAFCADRELPIYRAKQVFEWVYQKGVTDFHAMTSLPVGLRRQLAGEWVIFRSSITRQRESTDGTVKLLLEWPDGATSECVLIPDGPRRTACISSQVGCPVRCAFCASGVDGLQRQLTAGEIVEQAMRIRALCAPRPGGGGSAVRRPVPPVEESQFLTNVVFMGLGEPLANYGAVIRAIRIMNAEWGMHVGARRMTVSTVGLPRQMHRLASEDMQVNLAVSLHAPNDDLRVRLIPWAARTPMADLVAAGRQFFDATGREVTIEYILLAGVNDSVGQARELAGLCRQMRCNVNVIRYNPVPGLDFVRPTSTTTQRFVQQLRSLGVNAHVRKSRGLDIEAACGQLRRAAAPPAVGEPGTEKCEVTGGTERLSIQS